MNALEAVDVARRLAAITGRSVLLWNRRDGGQSVWYVTQHDDTIADAECVGFVEPQRPVRASLRPRLRRVNLG